MLAHPRFDETDLKREQRVIIEEMKMVEDTPEEYLGEIFNAAYFPHHSLGRPIEGTAKTVSTFGCETTARYHAQQFTPRNLVIAAAGNIEHEALTDWAAAAFSAEADAPEILDEAAPQPAAPIILKRKRDLEQAHCLIAAPWPSATDADRYAGSLLLSILGGSTSSRLWQQIREERGLAYSVGAGASAWADVGVFSIYAGTSPEKLNEVVDLSLAEMRRIKREAVSADELQLFKEQSVSSILLGLESSSARAGTLARQEIIHGQYVAPDEIIKRLEAVTIEDIQRLARQYFKTADLAFAALGNLNGFKLDRGRLEI